MPAASAPVDALSDALLRDIAAGGAMRRYPANTVLIHEGDNGDTLFILLAGRVKVYATSAEGREVVIATHGAGEYVGELALDGGVRSASVMTLEPTACSVVSGARLREFVASHPDFALHLVRKLIRSVRQATDSVKSLALEDVYERLVRLFGSLGEPLADGSLQLRERLTQQAMADRIGASREMVSRIVKDLTAGGYLETIDRRLVVTRRLPASW